MTVEVFGVLQRQSGCERLQVAASTVGEALAAAARQHPALGRLLDGVGGLGSDYRVAVNGGVIELRAERRLSDGDSLVVLSAQAGG